jgi:bifunctional DNase/RNase
VTQPACEIAPGDGAAVEFDLGRRRSIALAVRFECPIFVAAEVLDRAGVTPEKDEEKVPEGDKVPEEKDDEGRLAIFHRLVNSLDLPELPDEPDSRGPGSSSS